MPDAPASIHSLALSLLIPPIAYTGTVTALQISLRNPMPRGFTPALQLVSYICPAVI